MSQTGINIISQEGDSIKPQRVQKVCIVNPAGEGLGSVHQYSGYTSCLAQLIYDLINRQFLCVVSQTGEDLIVAAG